MTNSLKLSDLCLQQQTATPTLTHPPPPISQFHFPIPISQSGVIIFGANDPFNFGYVHVAMQTLVRVVTFTNWGDVMYKQVRVGVRGRVGDRVGVRVGVSVAVKG